MARRPFFSLLLALISFLVVSCGHKEERPPAKILPITEVHQQFIKLCKEEYNLDVIIKPLTNTVWIYVPTEYPIIDYKATPKSNTAAEPKNKFTINFLETIYQDGVFKTDYDIGKMKTYPKDLGYGTSYSEQFSKINRDIFTAIMRVYFNTTTENPSSAEQVDATIASNHLPEFFVLTLADTVRGVKLEFIFHLDDFKKQVTGYLPYEEYSQRMLYEMKGDMNLVNDKTGASIIPHEITMPEFLAKQITNRLQFKYGRSDFPPSADTKAEILYQINETFTMYNFWNFEAVKLHDLSSDSMTTIIKPELSVYKDMPAPAEGTLHTIKFF